MTHKFASELSILCDLTRLKRGGGLQVGLSFLESLAGGASLNWEILASSELLDRTTRSIQETLDVRLPSKFEPIGSRSPAHVHFQLFGPGRFAPRQRTRVAGCAYSNLFYPEETEFWSGLGNLEMARRRTQDVVRETFLKQQDELIFETAALRERCIRQWSFHPEHVHVIRPSVSEGFIERFQNSNIEALIKPRSDTLTLAMISGDHPNKRLGLGVEALAKLSSCSDHKFRLLFTIDPKTVSAQRLRDQARSLGVAENIQFVGHVPQGNIAALYKSVDAVLLFSRLESFSNNVIECMASKTVLFTTDADWSRAQAGRAAIYVDPTESEITAKTISNTLLNTESMTQLRHEAQVELKKFPSSSDRIRLFEETLISSHRRKHESK